MSSGISASAQTSASGSSRMPEDIQQFSSDISTASNFPGSFGSQGTQGRSPISEASQHPAVMGRPFMREHSPPAKRIRTMSGIAPYAADSQGPPVSAHGPVLDFSLQDVTPYRSASSATASVDLPPQVVRILVNRESFPSGSFVSLYARFNFYTPARDNLIQLRICTSLVSNLDGLHSTTFLVHVSFPLFAVLVPIKAE